MSEHVNTEKDLPEMKETKERLEHAMAIIANAEIMGYQAEQAFKTLRWLKDFRDVVDKDILALTPKKQETKAEH